VRDEDGLRGLKMKAKMSHDWTTEVVSEQWLEGMEFLLVRLSNVSDAYWINLLAHFPGGRRIVGENGCIAVEPAGVSWGPDVMLGEALGSEEARPTSKVAVSLFPACRSLMGMYHEGKRRRKSGGRKIRRTG
jgi:hypothetical protein